MIPTKEIDAAEPAKDLERDEEGRPLACVRMPQAKCDARSDCRGCPGYPGLPRGSRA